EKEIHFSLRLAKVDAVAQQYANGLRQHLSYRQRDVSFSQDAGIETHSSGETGYQKRNKKDHYFFSMGDHVRPHRKNATGRRNKLCAIDRKSSSQTPAKTDRQIFLRARLQRFSLLRSRRKRPESTSCGYGDQL